MFRIFYQTFHRWSSIEFSHLNVDDLKDGTEMIEYELDEAKESLGDNPMSESLRHKTTTQKGLDETSYIELWHTPHHIVSFSEKSRILGLVCHKCWVFFGQRK